MYITYDMCVFGGGIDETNSGLVFHEVINVEKMSRYQKHCSAHSFTPNNPKNQSPRIHTPKGRHTRGHRRALAALLWVCKMTTPPPMNNDDRRGCPAYVTYQALPALGWFLDAPPRRVDREKGWAKARRTYK